MIAKDSALRRLAVAYLFLEFQFWFPVWMLFLTERGFALTTMVLADAVFRFTMVSLEFPLGVLGDYIGRKRSFIVICILAVLTYVGIVFIDGSPMLFATWILWGVFWAMSSGTTSAYTYEIIVMEGRQETAVNIFGFMRSVSSGAALISLLAAGFLFTIWSALPFAVNGIFAFLALLLAFTLPEIVNGVEPQAHQERQTFKDFISVLNKNSIFFASTLLLAVSLIYFWSPRILMQPLFIEMAISPWLISAVYFFYSLAGVVAGLMAGRLQSLFGDKVSIIFGFTSLWLGVFLIAIVPGTAVLFFFPMLSFGYYLAQTILEVLLHQYLENRYRASFLSAISFIGGTVIILTRPSLGIIADRYSAQTAFLIWAILGVGFLVMVAIYVPQIGNLSMKNNAQPFNHELQ